MIPLSVSSGGQLIAALRDRYSKWSGLRASARLTVPPELSWWHHQEFGTAPYPIDPITGEALAFPQGGQTVIREHVDHPGLKPKRMVTQVLPDIENKTSENVNRALAEGGIDDPEMVRAAVIQSVRDAKELIVQSIAQNLPGTRPANPDYPKQGGKLEGRTAAEVFEAEAVVVEE